MKFTKDDERREKSDAEILHDITSCINNLHPMIHQYVKENHSDTQKWVDNEKSKSKTPKRKSKKNNTKSNAAAMENV